MGVFENNLASLQKFYPETFAKVQNVLRHGELIKVDDLELKILEKMVKGLEVEKPSFIAFFGLGSGNHIKTYLSSGKKLPKVFLFCEQSIPVFIEFLKHSDWTQLLSHPAAYFAISMTQEEAYKFLLEMINTDGVYFNLNHKMTVHYPGLKKHDLEFYQVIDQFLSDPEKHVSYGSVEDNYKAYRNIIENLNSSRQSVPLEQYQGYFDGKPGVLVSSGPSLNHTLPFLKAIQGKAVIVCADSALKTLLKEGIEVQAVGCLERLAETARFFTDLPKLPHTFLLSSPYIYPEIYRKYPGPKLDMMRATKLISWFYPKRKSYDVKSSVAHLNFVALKELGCSPIYLLGQDLAFDPFSQATHLKGLDEKVQNFWNDHRLESTKKDDQYSFIESNDGNLLASSEVFYKFKMVLESLIIGHDGIYNIMPPQYGAKIKGAQRLSLDEALQHVNLYKEKIEFSGWLRSFPYQNFDENRLVEERVQISIKKFNEYSQISLDAMDMISTFLHAHDFRFNDDIIYKPLLQKIEEIMGGLISDPLGFFDHLLYPIIVSHFVPLYNKILNNISKQESGKGSFIAEQIELVMSIFSLIHTWSNRMNYYLQKTNPCSQL